MGILSTPRQSIAVTNRLYPRMAIWQQRLHHLITWSLNQWMDGRPSQMLKSHLGWRKPLGQWYSVHQPLEERQRQLLDVLFAIRRGCVSISSDLKRTQDMRPGRPVPAPRQAYATMTGLSARWHAVQTGTYTLE